MKSKEALEELKDEIIPSYALEYDDDEGYKNWIIELCTIIKQDLEHKEKLENRLKEIETNYNYIQLGKLEKAIEILKDHIEIYSQGEFMCGKLYGISCVDSLDQQEYELLEEVLGNV